MAITEQQLRVDLAAAFRCAARLNFHEGIANHFSVATSADGRQFLLNPRPRHFSRIKASELLLLDADDPDILNKPNAPDITAWHLHGKLHQVLPQARCILHTHMPYTTALTCLKDFEFLMLDQNACRFYNRIAYDPNYDGIAVTSAEGERVAKLMAGGKSVLFMGNHGVMVVGPSVAVAFDELYHLEKAAQVQVYALSTQQKLALVPNEIAAKAGKQWLEYPQLEQHLAELKEILDVEEPDYIN